ncbi:MAG: hypothetical protein FWH03_05490 [Firmicutes bacterium]|nr:hypothetical protein [Bacillota bacterium]
MKTYRGTLSRTLNWEAIVSANNEDEAKELIDKMIENGEITNDNAQVGYIEIHDIEEDDEKHCCFNCKHRPPEEVQNDGKFDCPHRPQSCGNLNSREHYDCYETPKHKCIACGTIIYEDKQNTCYFCDTMEVGVEPIFCKTQCVFDYYGIGLIAVAELDK